METEIKKACPYCGQMWCLDSEEDRPEEVCRRLQRYAQRRAMAHYGWSVGQFRAVFGRNYLDQEE